MLNHKHDDDFDEETHTFKDIGNIPYMNDRCYCLLYVLKPDTHVSRREWAQDNEDSGKCLPHM